jgi:hypothetical protein
MGKPATIGDVLEKIAERYGKATGTSTMSWRPIGFEHGFDHHAGGFDASVDPTRPFSQ